MGYEALSHDLDRLLAETYDLWDPGWVTFNWHAYTYDHVQRVRGLAVNLCKAEGGDLRVVELAALLHDITKLYDGEYVVDDEGKRTVDARGYWHNEVRRPPRSNVVTRLYDQLELAGQLHNESGATIAHHLLVRRGVDADTCARVAQTIRDHLRPSEQAEVESRCLYDADTIDANVGLPAFVRNIYIHLHFHDIRKSPETPSLAELLRESPMDYVRPYVLENLPRWGAGKRRDFIPRLLTESGRRIALARLDRLETTFDCLAGELEDYATNSQHGCLSAILHFMHHRDDPSIAEETGRLVKMHFAANGSSSLRAFLVHLQREMAGLE